MRLSPAADPYPPPSHTQATLSPSPLVNPQLFIYFMNYHHDNSER